MKKLFLLTILVVSSVAGLFAQQPIRRLPSIINHPSLNLFSPFISADGNAIVFMTDNGRDGEYVVSYTSRDRDWTAPVELPKHINNRLNFSRGYALSANGKKLYFTSAKSPVIGGYDIFVTELKNGVWTNPENLMLPLNSKQNDGCPSVTPDESAMYFMRCDRMNTTKAEGCKIFRATKKPNGQWSEPDELPATINTGNSQTPRILADGETLIFSSDKFPGNRGGMDLYMTRIVNGSWSEPVAMNFLNSDRDDQYVSVSALGRYVLTEARGQRKNWELTEYLIPAEFKPKALTKIEGQIKGQAGEVVKSYISVRDLGTGKRVYSARPNNDGAYFFYLSEGSQYEVAIDPEDSDRTFFVKHLDLTGDKIMQMERIDATLIKPEAGVEIDLSTIRFEPFSATLTKEAEEVLKRFSRLIKANPGLTFEIQVLLTGYRESGVASDPDLTEELSVQPTQSEHDALQPDVMSADLPSDSLVTNQAPSVLYHNDRTDRQARQIVAFLISSGVASHQLATMVNAIPAPDGSEPKTTVRILVRRTN